jgi:subtilisin family serine protease
MVRYIVAPRLAAQSEQADGITILSLNSVPLRSALHSLRASFSVQADIPEAPEETAGTMVVECDADTAAAKRRELSSDAIVESEKFRWHGLLHPLAAQLPVNQPLPAGLGAEVELRVTLQNDPLEGVVAILYLTAVRGGYMTTSTAVTDASGRAALVYDPRTWFPVNIAMTPRSRAWAGYAVVTGARVAVALTALPRSGPLGWWHRALGLNSYSEELGGGIRVGIIDTGIGAHPYLSHVKHAGAILDGKPDKSAQATDDVAEHGTHVAGIIGARPTDLKDFAGIAPGADLVAMRVYRGGGPVGNESGVATNGDIAQAIISLSRDEQCDIINLSSGGPLRSEIEIDRITAAFNSGTLLVCAAGNGSGPPVLYPAAEPNVIGVSALGIVGGVPIAALDIFSMPPMADRYSGVGGFLAAFSSFGPEIKCIGPGVGIISTVPPRGESSPPYLAASGTSMAAPAVAGALAAILSRDPIYKSLPRNRDRSLRAWNILAGTLRSLGLYFPYQGFGLPTVLAPRS